MVGMDTFSKLVMGSTTISQSGKHFYKSVKKWIKKNGCPDIIQTDNGGPFVNECK
jgi:hypothetical protein